MGLRRCWLLIYTLLNVFHVTSKSNSQYYSPNHLEKTWVHPWKQGKTSNLQENWTMKWNGKLLYITSYAQNSEVNLSTFIYRSVSQGFLPTRQNINCTYLVPTHQNKLHSTICTVSGIYLIYTAYTYPSCMFALRVRARYAVPYEHIKLAARLYGTEPGICHKPCCKIQVLSEHARLVKMHIIW